MSYQGSHGVGRDIGFYTRRYLSFNTFLLGDCFSTRLRGSRVGQVSFRFIWVIYGTRITSGSQTSR